MTELEAYDAQPSQKETAPQTRGVHEARQAQVCPNCASTHSVRRFFSGSPASGCVFFVLTLLSGARPWTPYSICTYTIDCKAGRALLQAYARFRYSSVCCSCSSPL